MEMKKIRATLVAAAPVTVGSTLVVAACALPFASAAHSEAGTVVPVPRSGPCNLQPSDRDLIIWERSPRLPDSAVKVGDVDGVNCKPTIDDWKTGEPTGPGYCAKIAWASDNPGYDADVRPAPPLKKVIDEVGGC
jgi:hypothetical protein